MSPASAISWGLWLNPGGHSSNVANLINFVMFTPVGEGSLLFFLGLGPKLWVGGGPES